MERRTARFALWLVGAALVYPLHAAAQSPLQVQDLTEDQWIQMKAEQGESHASGMRPDLGPVVLGNPAQAVVVLRVGLCSTTFKADGTMATEFSSVNHPLAEVSHTAGDVHVIDRGTGKKIVTISPGMIVRVSHGDAGYEVSLDGASLGHFGGPIYFRPTDAANLFRVESIRRAYSAATVPSYRGAIEIARGLSTAAGRVNVVNLVELEDYVPGVVANESIASFEMEALKAQAVAARGYAVANVGNWVGRGYPFDVVDSSSSQVYRGVISEHPRAVQASAETVGLVASYQGAIIGALYSSSFGGHSESNEWIFNSPSSQLPGTNATPYLRAIYDGDGVVPDFSTPEGVAAFWSACQPSAYDSYDRVRNRFARWKLELTGAQIKSRLTSGRYVLLSGDLTGTITDVVITQRMSSGRAAVAKISLTSGEVEVRGWDNLRNVLGRTVGASAALCGGSQTGANFTLNNPSVIEVTKNTDGTVNKITAWGGGWGHNVGFSQYGSNGRAKAGQNFLQILKAYYTGIDVGSYPIDIGRSPASGTPTLRQQFVASNARGTLVVRASDLKGLRVHINETYDVSFTASELAAGVVRVDVSPYLAAGLNTLQYNAVGRDGTAIVTVVVE